ncbi:MAG: hypothetical protein AAB443_01570 [Patescibacteria group bacterium]
MDKLKIGVLTVILALVLTPLKAWAWKASGSAKSSCVLEKAVIKVSFSNTELNGEQNVMNVIAKDLASTKTVALGSIAPGQTKNGEIKLDTSSTSANSVLFELSWINGREGKDKRFANYSSVDCKATEEPNEEPKEPKEEKSKNEKAELKVKKMVKLDGTKDYKENLSNVSVGDTLVFKIDVKNTGEKDVVDIEVFDELPIEFKVLDGELIKELERLPDNQKFSYTIRVKVKETGKVLSNDCVENKVKAKADINGNGSREKLSSDTVKVCFSGSLKRLPKTGTESLLIGSLIGLSLLTLGKLLQTRL